MKRIHQKNQAPTRLLNPQNLPNLPKYIITNSIQNSIPNSSTIPIVEKVVEIKYFN